MRRIAIVGAAALFAAMTAFGGVHTTHAVTLRTYDTCHFNNGSSFKVYDDNQEDHVEQGGGSCSGPIN